MQSSRAGSSVLAPEHKAFLVNRLGYSPDQIIQLAPLGEPDSAQTRRLERWRGAIKRQQTALSTKAASALGIVYEALRIALRLPSSSGQRLPRSLLGSLVRRIKAPRMTISAAGTASRWRKAKASDAQPTKKRKQQGLRVVMFRRRGRGFSQENRATTHDVLQIMAQEHQRIADHKASLPLPIAKDMAKHRAIKRPSDLSSASEEIIRPQALDEQASGIRWSKLSHGDEWL
jgi:hypothetical protein